MLPKIGYLAKLAEDRDREAQNARKRPPSPKRSANRSRRPFENLPRNGPTAPIQLKTSVSADVRNPPPRQVRLGRYGLKPIVKSRFLRSYLMRTTADRLSVYSELPDPTGEIPQRICHPRYSPQSTKSLHAAESVHAV